VSRGRSTLAVVALVALGLSWSAAQAGDAAAQPVTLTGAVLEWSVNDESNTGAFNGQCNFMSGGISDGSAATYRATDRGATVLKRTTAGTDVPVSDYAARCRDANGTTVTAGGTARLGQKVRYSGGSGTIDPATGEATIAWSGTFSLNYYGSLVPFWFSDPVLRVDAAGNGTVTATVGGYASSIDDPDERELIEPIPDVEIATLRGVQGANLDGFVATPVFEGVQVDAAESPQIRVLPGWGSWPVSHVRAMERLGLGAFWYTTGGAADVRKPADPVVVAYGTGTAPTTTTTTPPTTAAPTTAAPTTVPPTTVSPTTAPTAPASGGLGVSAGVLSSSGAGSSSPSSSSTARRSSSGSTAGTGSSATGSTVTGSTGPIADAGAPGDSDLEAAASGSTSSADDEPAETAELVFSELSASYDASLNPFSPGTMRLTYSVRNTSDVELRASRSATVTPAWGDEVTSVADEPLVLGPGERATFTQSVPGIWPGGDTRSQVELDPTVAEGAEAVRTRAVVARTTSALTPWPQIVAVLLAAAVLAAAIAVAARARRRGRGRLADVPAPQAAGAEPAGDALNQHPTPWRTT
jgi:hypothetical protein